MLKGICFVFNDKKVHFPIKKAMLSLFVFLLYSTHTLFTYTVNRLPSRNIRRPHISIPHRYLAIQLLSTILFVGKLRLSGSRDKAELLTWRPLLGKCNDYGGKELLLGKRSSKVLYTSGGAVVSLMYLVMTYG